MVLDAAGVLTFLRGDPGADQVARAVADGAVLSAAGLFEVLRLAPAEVPAKTIKAELERIGLEVVALDQKLTFEMARYHQVLDFEKCSALALAKSRGLPWLVSAGVKVDQSWNVKTVKLKVVP